MRKFLCILIATSMLFLSNVKPAKAGIVFDLTEIASEVSEIVGKITDAAGKITNSVNMVKQTLAQGFSKEMLLNMVTRVAGKYINNFIASKTADAVVDATDAKNKEILAKDVETYQAATEEELKNKLSETKKQRLEVTAAIVKAKAAVIAKRTAVDAAKKRCENVKTFDRAIHPFAAPNEVSSASDNRLLCELYRKEDAKLSEMELTLANLESKEKEIDQVIINLNKQKLDMKNDPKLKKLEARVEDIQKRIDDKKAEMEAKRQEKEALIQKAKDEAQWDGDESLLEDFKVNEKDYQYFLNTYFYNPLTIVESENKFIAHQGKRDDVERARRQLIVESAVHLMQVSSTLRAETVSRKRIIEGYIKTTIEGEGETESISSYTASKVEYIRALLLYAKMQTAKLQYQAAKEVFESEVDKEFDPNNIKKFLSNDLKRWQLTKKEIRQLVKKNKRKTID